jgi:hypothetical protein
MRMIVQDVPSLRSSWDNKFILSSFRIFVVTGSDLPGHEAELPMNIIIIAVRKDTQQPPELIQH